MLLAVAERVSAEPPSPIPTYRSPSGPNATTPPLWFANGWSTWRRIRSLSGSARSGVALGIRNDEMTVSPWTSV